MKRRLAALAGVLLLAGLLSACGSPAQAAYYPPRDGCMSITWDTSTSRPYYMTWMSGFHRAGTWRVAMNCGSVNYRSFGQAFDGGSCTEVRLINLGTDWVIDSVGPWMTTCGGQAPIKMANVGVGGVRVNDRVYFDCRDLDVSQRQSSLHCLFRFTL